jgi:hypothetical protein
LDGQLLCRGSITFVPVDDRGQVASGRGPGGGDVINEKGNYTIKRGLRPGKYRVEIRSTRTLDRKVPNPTIPPELVDEEVSVIPEEYNTRSSLVREVKPGSQVLDFPLEGAPDRR